MEFRGSNAWKAKFFDDERRARAINSGLRTVFYTERDGGWILFGPRDIRYGAEDYRFALQYLKCDRTLRVRVGCRFKTLPQAWTHWSKKARSRDPDYRNQGRQALTIIKLMILQAQACRLLSIAREYPFDSSIVRKKRIPR